MSYYSGISLRSRGETGHEREDLSTLSPPEIPGEKPCMQVWDLPGLDHKHALKFYSLSLFFYFFFIPVLPILLIKTDLWTPAGNAQEVRTSVQSTFQIFENFPKNMLLMDRLASFEACHILSLTAPRLHNMNHVFGVIRRVIHSCAASW